MSSVTADYKLFTPLELSKDFEIKNRIVYGPTTRARSDPETHVPLERNIVYYEQRAGAGLLITEGCGISEQGFGWYGAPALYTDEQEAKWKELVDRAFKGNVMANNSYTRDTAEGVVRSGAADFVGFARLFMSNPDLAERFQNDWPVNPVPDYKYFWDAAMGDKGYNTFEHYKPTVEEQP
eukprot:jgi/Phyca11/17161/fgenesh1_pg.PHYCAscaffold_25_\